MSKDIAILDENDYFRYRACGIIIENDAVLMASNDRENYFYSIGGAVKIGEIAEEACLREVFEETGVHFEIDRLIFIHENFFEMNDKACHELAFYFLMKPQKHRNFTLGLTQGVTEHLTWIPLTDYKNCQAYPVFFADELIDLSELTAVKRIVTYE